MRGRVWLIRASYSAAIPPTEPIRAPSLHYLARVLRYTRYPIAVITLSASTSFRHAIPVAFSISRCNNRGIIYLRADPVRPWPVRCPALSCTCVSTSPSQTVPPSHTGPRSVQFLSCPVVATSPRPSSSRCESACGRSGCMHSSVPILFGTCPTSDLAYMAVCTGRPPDSRCRTTLPGA